MKITRRQLRKIIAEAITASEKGVTDYPETDRSPRMRSGTAPRSYNVKVTNPTIKDLIKDPNFKDQGYELSDVLSDYEPGATQASIEDEQYSKDTIKYGNLNVNQDIVWQRKQYSVPIPAKHSKQILDTHRQWKDGGKRNDHTEDAFRNATRGFFDYINQEAGKLSGIAPSNWDAPEYWNIKAANPGQENNNELEQALWDAGAVL